MSQIFLSNPHPSLHLSSTPTIFFPHISPNPINLEKMSSPPPPPQLPSSSSPPESTAAKTTKRYEGLITIRTKAIKGKGAWYWTHLEPILVNNTDTGLPNAVKLRCCLCDAVFSASNPSRTASEHLKRGTCPNFNHDPNPQPISSISPTGILTSSHRKRSSAARNRTEPYSGSGSYPTRPVSEPGPYPARSETESGPYTTRPGWAGSGSGSGSGSGQVPAALPAPVEKVYATHSQQYVQLSGGKEDLNALAMLEDSVKRLKSPKTLPGQTLTKSQIDASLELLTDWLYENCGSVGFGISCVTHPKFKVFLNQLGLPAISSREIAGNRLDLKFLSVKSESEARIRDALFFQLSSNGWKSRNQENQETGSYGSNGSNYQYPYEKLVNLSVNLPNGTRVFRRGVFANGYVFSNYAEDVLMETIVEICGNNLEKCVGIVSDKFKSTALTSIESQHQWMINLCCQYQGVCSLVKDFSKELPLFNNVVDGCFKVANFVNTSSQIRNLFLKYQFQESGRARLLRVPLGFVGKEFGFEGVFDMVEDVFASARTLQLVLHDEGYQKVSMEDRLAREVEETMRNQQFWREIEAVHSLVKLVKDMAQEIEKERPRIGQCLPLWEEVRVKVKDWCVKFQMNEIVVDKVFDKRFKKNYHPAWAAAFILDPFYLIKDRSGRYLPPFKYLTPDQEKDVDKLITRLVSREEAHIALMELMKWRTDGLDPVYAQAVQLKQRDPITGKMKIANPQSSRLVWETYLTEFSSLRKVAVRLIFLHATSCGFKSNSSFLKWARSRTGVEKAQKLMFIAANSRIERRDLFNDDEKDADFFAEANGEDDNNMINEVLFDASSP